MRRLPLQAARVLVPGLYAWLVTVAMPAAHREAGWLPRVFAGLALIALVGGPLISAQNEQLGRRVGVFGFLGASLVTWIGLDAVLEVGRVDPLRAALGSVGWALFAFGWGSVREVGAVPEQDPHVLSGELLVARSVPPRGAAWILGLGMVGAVGLVVLAWRVDRPIHALLGHAVALVAAIAVVTVAAHIGALQGTPRRAAPARARLDRGARWLVLAALLLGFGAMLRALF
ncbi:MAG: hypothetical protein KIT72_05290 [Polyangiaceae bacterium]|nr:hypothetical protein [Polyangiaceae bacterium]MCW5789812.1 hypothetical protein [Polyangiaceae bacterium]